MVGKANKAFGDFEFLPWNLANLVQSDLLE
jgi:hypothetical protein